MMKDNNDQTNKGKAKHDEMLCSPNDVTTSSIGREEKGNNKVSDEEHRFPSQKLLGLIREFDLCDTSVSVQHFLERALEIRQLSDLLDKIADKYAQEADFLHRRKASASAEFDRLREAQWLTGPLALEELVGVIANPSIAECSELYRQANAALAEINSCCDRLDEAARRMQRGKEIVVDLRQTSLEDAVIRLLQRVKDFDDELSRVSRQEAEIAEVLDLVSELPPSDSAAALIETTFEIRVALFCYVSTGP